VKLHVTAGGPPPGNYAATFDGVESTEHEEYGPGLRWRFRISQGPHAGEIATRVTGTNPTSKNGCGKVLAALLGRELQMDEDVDVQSCVGRSYLIVVAAAKFGGTRVEAIVAAPPTT
jgi:hypothetical protein